MSDIKTPPSNENYRREYDRIFKGKTFSYQEIHDLLRLIVPASQKLDLMRDYDIRLDKASKQMHKTVLMLRGVLRDYR